VSNNTEGMKNWIMMNEYLIYRGYKRDKDVAHVYDDIFRIVNGSSFRVLIYQGDTDLRIPTLHTLEATRRIAERNSLEEMNTGSAWRFY
ncbi:hypothetical protein PMAYCL1PPCAC_25118, partial [Pristionchus mayeri]